MRQVHGSAVVSLAAEESCEGREADALVSSLPGDPLAVFAADCALVGLASPEGVVGAAHAGWRGLALGVIERTIEAMGAAGASEVRAVVGPTIGPECYPFGEAELSGIERRYGPSVRGRARDGALALDLRAGVRRALEAAGARLVGELGGCTACDPGWYSWRARRDNGRHALVVTAAGR